MAHFHVKTKKGRPYLYVREIARVDGKPKVISQIYIGSPEKVANLLGGKEIETLSLKVEEFGALWLAHQIDRDIDLCSIVDDVVPKAKKETRPSVGEYFLYCVLNRMVEAVSKNKLADWYRNTAIQHIRPIDLDELTSKRYWEKWERVSETDLQAITRRFFERIWEVESPTADCLLFDTTNYYTYMASQTESTLAQRGKSKAGKHHLRQIGLGLLVARDSRLPLHYSVYPGNIHDSKHFETIMDEMFGVVCGLNKTKERLTVVIDKGMNADDNYAWIDEHARMHFITTYSTYFAQELAATPLDRFEPADTAENRRLHEQDKEDECLLAYRTKGEYWGKERTVIVTYTPSSARKQAMFGKNIIITDNTDWLTSDIIETNLARWQVEDRFRLSKNDDLVGVSLVRHWTDSKIRCHLFTCVVAMTYLRRIELKMEAAGKKRSAEEIMEDMQHLHYVLSVKKGSRTPERRLETPSKTQNEVLSAFGYHVDSSGVLQGTAT